MLPGPDSVIVGISTTVFLELLDLGISGAAPYLQYFLLRPAALFLSALVKKLKD